MKEFKHLTHNNDNEKPFKQAIALHYDEKISNPVPEVTATGQNEIAQQIIDQAEGKYVTAEILQKRLNSLSKLWPELEPKIKQQIIFYSFKIFIRKC